MHALSPPIPPPDDKRRRRRKSAEELAEAKYLSASAFARYASLGRSTVWRMMKSGRLRYVRLSATLVRIPITELARLGRQPVSKLADKDRAE
jgi:excisionase family DNA binding protein